MLDMASFFKRWDYDTTPVINFNGVWNSNKDKIQNTR